MDASLVEVGGETIQLAMQVETVPEEGLIEILAPKGSDKALYKWVRAGYEGDGLKLLDVENAQIRTPAVKSEQRVMIGTEAPGKWGPCRVSLKMRQTQPSTAAELQFAMVRSAA